MSKEDIEEIRVLYNEVFDENGNIQLCGRNVCKKLMSRLNNIFQDVDFGDMNSGFMNIDVVKKYSARLF